MVASLVLLLYNKREMTAISALVCTQSRNETKEQTARTVDKYDCDNIRSRSRAERNYFSKSGRKMC